MPRLIRNRSVVPDQWTLIRDLEQALDFPALAGQDIVVPLASWLDYRKELLEREGRTGVWLDSHELPAALGDDLHELALVALNFPVFSDGRPYSSARELRANLGYQGELRAIGDVLRDQLFYMSRCGFDSFAIREDQDIEACLRAFDDFADGYQSSVIQPQPLFRRRG